MDTSEPTTDAKVRAVEEASSHVDPTWKGVYKVGGVCTLIIGLAYLIGAVLSIIIGPPPSGGELYLQSLAGHAVLSQVNFGAFALADFLMLPAGMALFLALKHRAKNAMLLGAGIMVMAFVLDLAVTELNSLTLVSLTQQYAAATSEVQRSAYVAAADYALATLPIATFSSYVVSSIGLLIISVVMLKGVFSRLTAYLGIVASIEGIVGGFYVLLPALAVFLVPCLITFGIWLLLTGSKLYRLSNSPV
ncbi:MAG: hypothetical protein ACYC1C_03150 [Chloroflexota bacterium]